MRLSDQVREETEAGNLLPTPAANLATSGPDYARAERDGSGGNDLCTAVHLLPTPQAHDAQNGKTPEQVEAMRAKGHGVSILVENDLLQSGGKLLPTPTAERPDGRKSPGFAEGRANFFDIIENEEFGLYADAIARWEAVMGREAPAPTELTPKGKHRLSARFVEWMMGQDDGWVTAEELGLSRVQQLRALGNGVVTQQAVYAIEWLLERANHHITKEEAA